ncbi:MAG: FtsQ-type POTRA domain-containing protein [Gemmatimonadales bacterium]
MSEPIGAPVTPRKRRVRWRLIAAIMLLLLIAPAAFYARRGATRMDYFHVRTIEVEGAHYLDPATVVERLGVDTMRSVWDDNASLVTRLKTLPQVGNATITRKLPGTLVVTVRENLPVALSPSPRGLEAVDSAGVVLPIDPSSVDLDLPIALQRDAPMLALLGALRSSDAALFNRISQIGREGRDGIVLLLERRDTGALTPADSVIDSVAFTASASRRGLRVRAMVGVSVSRLADIFPVESDLLRRRANVAELDLRYRDQVIARLQ